MTLEERIEKHRKMAESYHQAYANLAVKDGSTYDEWQFTDDAVYWSPYFGDNLIDLKTNPISVRQSATMDALSYSATLPDRTILGFKCWPSDNGFVMQSHFGGHDSDGRLWDFHAYGFIETNEECKITH